MAKAISILLIASLVFTPLSGLAQDPSALSDAQRELLGKLLTEARNAYDARDYPASIQRLEEAYAIFPEPNMLYRIAEMYEELQEVDKAIKLYEKYRTERPDAPNSAVVQTRIERLRAKQEAERPKTARLTVDSIPQGAQVFLEKRRGTTPLEFEVPPGAYEIKLTKFGYEEATRSIEVKAGELRSFEFAMVKREVEVAPLPPPPEPSIGPWILGGVGLASGVTSVLFWVLAFDRQSQIDAWDADRNASGRPSNYDQVLDQELTYRNVGWATAGIGAASLIGAGIWFWLDLDSEPDEPQIGLRLNLEQERTQLELRVVF